MKKYILYFLIFIIIVLLGQIVVKGYNYSGFKQEFRPSYSTSTKNFFSEPPTRLQLKQDNRTNEQLREFRNDTNEDTKYNSSCQFGVCTPGGPNNTQR